MPTRAGDIVIPLSVGAGLVVALVMTFFVAPRESEMGEVQRIFYMHVASAFATLLLFVSCSLASLAYLILHRSPTYRRLAAGIDRFAHACGEVSVLFGVVVLITGPLWAKPAWGTFWTWEPRLTLMLLTVFLFIGYVVLRSYARQDEVGRRLAAGVAVVAGPAAFLIHVAVQLWGGNHPEVVTGKGQGLEGGAMGATFAVANIAVIGFATWLVWLRIRHHRTRAEIETAFLDLSDLEDGKAKPT